jgi:predicted nuclease of predicted toxin-antitoxin system
MLKAYADVHVHTAIVAALRRRGMDVVTVQERGQQSLPDSTVLAQAFQENRVLLTNDQDFLQLAGSLAKQNETFAPIFFRPQQRRTIGQIVRSIIREATLSDYESACSRVFYL